MSPERGSSSISRSAASTRRRSRAGIRRRALSALLLRRTTHLMLQIVEQNVLPTGYLRLPFLDRLYFVGKCVFDGDLPIGILPYVAPDRFAQRLCAGEVVALAGPVQRYQLLLRQRDGDSFLRASAHG